MHGCKAPSDRSCIKGQLSVISNIFYFFENGEKKKKISSCSKQIPDEWLVWRRAFRERLREEWHSIPRKSRNNTHVHRILAIPSLRLNSATRLLAFKSIIPVSFVTILKKKKKNTIIVERLYYDSKWKNMDLNAREKYVSWGTTRNFNLYRNKTSRVRTRLFLDSSI